VRAILERKVVKIASAERGLVAARGALDHGETV
jgi:hypothetical protein